VDEFAVVSGHTLSTFRRLIRLVVSESKFKEDTCRGRLTARESSFPSHGRDGSDFRVSEPFPSLTYHSRNHVES
jgi:hypothetical protein